jgi:hypothetical protein
MHNDNVHHANIPQAALVTCSICLRVQHASGWMGAEEAIRELRTFELREPVRLAPGLCDDCSDALDARREHVFAEVA